MAMVIWKKVGGGRGIIFNALFSFLFFSFFTGGMLWLASAS